MQLHTRDSCTAHNMCLTMMSGNRTTHCDRMGEKNNYHEASLMYHGTFSIVLSNNQGCEAVLADLLKLFQRPQSRLRSGIIRS